jgi:heme-binding protein
LLFRNFVALRCGWLSSIDRRRRFGQAPDEGSQTMLLSPALRRAVVRAIGAGAIAVATLFVGAPQSFAQPTPTPTPGPPAPLPPGCTAADLAQVSGGVATAISDYLFSHPDVNDFFTSLHGRPTDEIRGDVQNYFNDHPQAQADLTGIRQPLTDLRSRCQ